MRIELEIHVGRNEPQIEVLDQESITIGRSGGCDLSIVCSGRDASHVAEKHARIELSSGQARLVDLDSPKGTWLNKRSVQSGMTVHQGDSFTLGRLGPTIVVRQLELPQTQDRLKQRRKPIVDIAVAVVLVVLVGMGIQFLRDKPADRNSVSGTSSDSLNEIGDSVNHDGEKGTSTFPPQVESTEILLARKAHGVLQKNCFECHGDTTYDQESIPSFATVAAMTSAGVLEPGNADSRIIATIHTEKSMPKQLDRATAEEKATIRDWIEVGAPDFDNLTSIEDQAQRDLAAQAGEFFRDRCFVCHHDGADVPSLITLSQMKQGYLAAGNPSDSAIWQRVREDEMPPQVPSVSKDDLKTVQDWLLAGAPEFPDPVSLPTVAIDDIVNKGEAFVEKYCAKCHVQKTSGGFVMTSIDEIHKKIKDPTRPEASRLWRSVNSGRMPKKGAGVVLPSEHEKQVFFEWVRAGTPLNRQPRDFVKFEQSLKAVERDLSGIAREDRFYMRYFTFASFHNDWQSITDEEMRQARAGLSKLVNSMSSRPDIRLPQAVDKHEIVFRIDLRNYGWTFRTWRRVLEGYPYGIDYTLDRRQNIRQMARRIATMSGTKLSFVRADWFIDFAGRGPLYYDILTVPDPRDPYATGMPTFVDELERRLGVDPQRDFVMNRLARAGFAESGVSGFNRLLDRHELSENRGYYWKSYDFKQSNASGNLLQFPLGPIFPNQRSYTQQQLGQFAPFAFEHDGGEIIFSLPNGLQGYFLTDGRGERIDAGPISVVQDAQSATGTGEVVNAVSCMGCHQHGMIQVPGNSVGKQHGLTGDARVKVQELYRDIDEMRELTNADQQRFLKACDTAILPFLVSDEDSSLSTLDFNDPVVPTAQLHQRDITLAKAAADLDEKDLRGLASMIGKSQSLMSLSVGPLSSGNSIDRSLWISFDDGTSVFQKVARELRLGDPLTDFEQGQTYSW